MAVAVQNSIIRYENQPRATNIPCIFATHGNHHKTSDAIYCDSVECSDGSVLVDDAADEECRMGVCTESQCCDMVCSSFDCPSEYSPVENSNSTVCRVSGCTESRCCEKGEKHPDNTAIVWGEYYIYSLYAGRLKSQWRREGSAGMEASPDIRAVVDVAYFMLTYWCSMPGSVTRSTIYDGLWKTRVLLPHYNSGCPCLCLHNAVTNTAASD